MDEHNSNKIVFSSSATIYEFTKDYLINENSTLIPPIHMQKINWQLKNF